MNRLQYLSTNRGSTHSLYLAMLLRKQPQSAHQLVGWTGLDHRTVEKGLALLESLGLVRQNRIGGTWALLAGAGASEDGQSTEEGEKGNDDADVHHVVMPAHSVSAPPPPPVYSPGNLGKEEEGAHKMSDRQRRVYQLLQAAGVGGGSKAMRELLARNLDPVYVQKHCEHARAGAMPVGHLITALRCGDPAPAPARRPDDYRQRIPEHLEGVIRR